VSARGSPTAAAPAVAAHVDGGGGGFTDVRAHNVCKSARTGNGTVVSRQEESHYRLPRVIYHFVCGSSHRLGKSDGRARASTYVYVPRAPRGV